mmetsp:Transcript_72435/g.204777  ORF Transcript_72435/g.204777 Transcript_72435/m.204777 type:complete len:549 (-) Transcript_72435:53-1699(-)
MRPAAEADQGHAHHERLTRRGHAVVREGVEGDVDPVVGLPEVAARARRDEPEAVRRHALRREARRDLGARRLRLQAVGLQHQDAAGHLAEDPRPEHEAGGAELGEVVEGPERERRGRPPLAVAAARRAGGPGHVRQARRRRVAEGAPRQAQQALGELLLAARGVQGGVRQQVVHCRQPRRVEVPQVRHLHRGRPQRHDVKPVLGRVACEVNQDTHPVLAYLSRHVVCGVAADVAPVRRRHERFQLRSPRVASRRAGVDEDLKRLWAVVLQQAPDEERRGAVADIGGGVAQAQAPPRRPQRGPRLESRAGALGEGRAPRPVRLEHGGLRDLLVREVVERQEPVLRRGGGGGLGLQAALVAPDGERHVALLQVHPAEDVVGLRQVRCGRDGTLQAAQRLLEPPLKREVSPLLQEAPAEISVCVPQERAAGPAGGIRQAPLRDALRDRGGPEVWRPVLAHDGLHLAADVAGVEVAVRALGRRQLLRAAHPLEPCQEGAVRQQCRQRGCVGLPHAFVEHDVIVDKRALGQDVGHVADIRGRVVSVLLLVHGA